MINLLIIGWCIFCPVGCMYSIHLIRTMPDVYFYNDHAVAVCIVFWLVLWSVVTTALSVLGLYLVASPGRTSVPTRGEKGEDQTAIAGSM